MALNEFAASTADYLTFTHAVLGAVIIGWGVAVLFIVLGPFRRGSPDGWYTVVSSPVNETQSRVNF